MPAFCLNIDDIPTDKNIKLSFRNPMEIQMSVSIVFHMLQIKIKELWISRIGALHFLSKSQEWCNHYYSQFFNDY